MNIVVIISRIRRLNNNQYPVWHDFDILLNIKTKSMKKQMNNDFISSRPDELKLNRKPSPDTKKPTYIYTEEDLGEGILDAGISS